MALELLVPIGFEEPPDFDFDQDPDLVRVDEDRSFDPVLLRLYAESRDTVEIKGWVILHLLDLASL